MILRMNNRNQYAQNERRDKCHITQNCTAMTNYRQEQSSFIFTCMTVWTRKTKHGRVFIPLQRIYLSPAVQSKEPLKIRKKPS